MLVVRSEIQLDAMGIEQYSITGVGSFRFLWVETHILYSPSRTFKASIALLSITFYQLLSFTVLWHKLMKL
jgi:hypothetical protein